MCAKTETFFGLQVFDDMKLVDSGRQGEGLEVCVSSAVLAMSADDEL